MFKFVKVSVSQDNRVRPGSPGMMSPKAAPPQPPTDLVMTLSGQRPAPQPRVCSVCKKTKVKPPITRCRACNTLNMRICNCKKTLDTGSLEQWDNLDPEKKAQFVRNTHGMMGSELRAKMISTISEELTRTDQVRFQDTGSTPGLTGFQQEVP